MAAKTPIANYGGVLGEVTAADQVATPAGAGTAPGLAVGEVGTGFYLDSPGVLGLSYGGSPKIRYFTGAPAAQVQRNDTDYAGPFTATGVVAQFQMLGTGSQTNGSAAILLAKGAPNVGGPSLLLGKTRSSAFNVAGVAALSGDSLGQIQFNGDDASDATKPAFTSGASIAAVAIETFGAAANGSRLLFSAALLGSTVLTEIARLEGNKGLSMFGANVVIDQNRGITLRSFTVATLPAAATFPSAMFWCSDLGGAGGVVVSNGSAWQALSPTFQVKSGTANFTLVELSDANDIRLTGSNANLRTVTLPAGGGARKRFTNTSGGAGGWSLGGLKTLATSTWGEVQWDNTAAAWFLAEYGSL